ncbi:MAG: histidine phosphatase family protein [Christensenellaceae bacterium]|jgi:broad specificity phosphatase PhoE|nr:histidine phosphatase family protein [Christensenellaceae bacterium]
MPFIYFLRHGSTPAHEGKVDARRLQGREEVFRDSLYERFKNMYNLSDLGKYQSYSAGGIMLALGATAKNLKVFASPQTRTQEAAQIACDIICDKGHEVEINTLEELNVLDMGRLTGELEGYNDGEVNAKMLMHPQAPTKYGSEPIPQFMHRIGKAYKIIVQPLKEGKDVFVCGHVCGIPLMMIMVTRPELFMSEGLTEDQMKANRKEVDRLYLEYDKVVTEGSAIAFDTETKELTKYTMGQNEAFEIQSELIYSSNGASETVFG